jgi:hypothetical protein
MHDKTTYNDVQTTIAATTCRQQLNHPAKRITTQIGKVIGNPNNTKAQTNIPNGERFKSLEGIYWPQFDLVGFVSCLAELHFIEQPATLLEAECFLK